MLKLILADAGTPEDASLTAQRALDTCQDEIKTAIAAIETLLENFDPVSAGSPWNGIAINLMADILQARHRWSEYALDATSRVDSGSDAAKRQALGEQAYLRALETLRQTQETPSR